MQHSRRLRLLVGRFGLALLTLCPLAIAPAQSQSLLRPAMSVSGFGTLGYAILNDDSAEYRTGEAQDGADEHGSFEVDSRLGLQLDATFTNSLSTTFQAIVREAEAGDAAAELEWGFLRWLPTDNLAVRVGRMSLPVFSISDYREVGYANTLLRPPEDVYSQIPLRRFDGMDITLDGQWREVLVQYQMFVGQAREKIFEDLEPEARDSIGASLSFEQGPVTVRFSHVDSRVDIDSGNANVAQVRAGIQQAQARVPALAPILAPLAEDFAGQRIPLSFDSLAVSLDYGRVFTDIEFGRRRVDSWVSNQDGWSVVLGARVGAVRPYLMISSLDEPDGDRRIDLPDNPQLDPLEAAINRFYEPRDQRTIGIGARWNVSPQFALKGQIDRISREVTGISLLRVNADDGSDTGEDVTLFSVAVDFIF